MGARIFLPRSGFVQQHAPSLIMPRPCSVETAVIRVAALALKRFIESEKTQITVTNGLVYDLEVSFYKPRKSKE